MKEYDIIVIGGGPGGYVAAIRAAQLGMKVACVDENEALGGTCLRVGCIPSKALLEATEQFVEAKETLARHGADIEAVEADLKAILKQKNDAVGRLTKGVASLLDKNKVERRQGHGRLAGDRKVIVKGSNGEVELAANHIIIATGSRSADLSGVEIDGTHVVTSSEALSFKDVPEHLVVIGAGYIGLEMGSVWSRMRAKVTVLEYMDRILPGMDAELAKQAHRALKKQGLTFRLGAKVTAAKRKKKKCVVEYEGGDPVECDRVLLAVGRVPNTEGLALDAVGLAANDGGRIPVDDHFATEAEGIYAIGDVIRGPMLAHKAQEEGVACVERIATGYGHVDYDAIPAVVYTQPEIASVGRTEAQLKEESVEYRKGTFSFRANGRAICQGQAEGFVKVLADANTDRLLGVHIFGPRAGDLIAECAVAMAFSASSEDLARCCHAHPTLPEVVKEAALAAYDRPIHS